MAINIYNLNKKLGVDYMINNFETGMSVFLGSDIEYISQIMDKTLELGGKYIFTSLNYLEENLDFEVLKQTVALANKKGLSMIIDVDDLSIRKFNIEEIKKSGNAYLRIDFRITEDEIIAFSKSFPIVLNASIISPEELKRLEMRGLEKDKTLICHNYFPKPDTGMDLEKIREINKMFHEFGCKVISFVPGDLVQRGPLYKGLPTVEDHRSMRFLRAVLECLKVDSDIVLVGDIDISKAAVDDLKRLNKGYLQARGTVPKELKDTIFYDRKDAAKKLIRDTSFRGKIDLTDKKISETTEFTRGDIMFTTGEFDRYFGEIEIAKEEIKSKERVLIGRVHIADLWMLDYVTDKIGIKIDVQ